MTHRRRHPGMSERTFLRMFWTFLVVIGVVAPGMVAVMVPERLEGAWGIFLLHFMVVGLVALTFKFLLSAREIDPERFARERYDLSIRSPWD
jgi:hypothetical protein